MEKSVFFNVITKHVAKEWKTAVHEGEERYARDEVGSQTHIIKIKEHAQLKLIHQLVDLKGDWLSVHELEYTLDLFNGFSSSFDYFKILHREKTGILRELREFVSTEKAV